MKETIQVNHTAIAFAEQLASHAPEVTLDAEALEALSKIQTSFPRSIELDYSEMEQLCLAATHAPAIEVLESDYWMYENLSTPYYFEDGFEDSLP